MKRSLLRRSVNRVFHIMARHLPGSTGLRPFLHRCRGVRIGQGVFIGEDVYLESDYPEAVEIQSGVQISIRAIIIAHTRGRGEVIIEKDAYVGPNVVIACSGNKVLRIGEGAVIGAGAVITSDVPAGVLVANEASRPVARASVPLTRALKMEDFIRGLAPLKRPAARAPVKTNGNEPPARRAQP